MDDGLDWRQHAPCGAAPDAFFPDEVKPRQLKAEAIRQAKLACERCPVIAWCGKEVARAEAGMPAYLRAGVYAAMTAAERAAADPVLRARRLARQLAHQRLAA